MQPLPEDRPGCSAPPTSRRTLFPARRIRHAALAAVLLGAAFGSSLAQAAPPIPAVQIGYGVDSKHDVQKIEAAFLWDSGFAWGNPQGWLLDLQWEVNVARWHSTSSSNPRNPWEFGVAPVVRLAWKRYSWVPFLELSLGLRLMSETRSSDDHIIRPPSSSRSTGAWAWPSARNSSSPWAIGTSTSRMAGSRNRTPARASARYTCVTASEATGADLAPAPRTLHAWPHRPEKSTRYAIPATSRPAECQGS